MILTIGQKVWAPKVAGVPAHKPQNNVYELVGPLEEEEGSVGGYQLKHGEHVFFAKQGTVKHLQDVKVCIECGSDKLQIPSWVDNLGNVLKEMDAEDPWCTVCEKILTRSFHCTLDEYLAEQEAKEFLSPCCQSPTRPLNCEECKTDENHVCIEICTNCGAEVK